MWRIQGVLLTAAVFVATGSDAVAKGLTVTGLRWDGRVAPLGLMQFEPRLSWVLQSDERGQKQTAYQVLVASDPALLRPGSADVWDSGKLTSAASIDVPFAGKPLQGRQRAYWTVRAWDKQDRPSPFAAPSHFEMALYDEEWQGGWIGRPAKAPGYAAVAALGDRSVVYLRKPFRLNTASKLGRVYASGFGVYELSINGQRVGDDVLAPGYTNYEKRALFQTYDVTKLLRKGDNVLGAVVAGGWCTAGLGGVVGACHDQPPRLMVQLEATLIDGTKQVVLGDESWRAHPGPIRSAHLCDGETYDARHELPGWNTAGYDDSAWSPAVLYDTKRERDLVPDAGAPMRVVQDVAAVKVSEPRPGVAVFDLGQNIVGWARLRAKVPAGATVTMKFAEALNQDGNLLTDNLQGCEATDVFTAKGGVTSTQTWEPKFTLHSFRYVEVKGLGPKPAPSTILGRVVHSEAPQTAQLESSDKRLNRLIQNIDWSLRSGFASVPTPFPAGANRAGALPQGRAIAHTSCLFRNVRTLLRKWTDDIRDAQAADATYADTAPAQRWHDGGPAAGSGGVVVPWALFECYADHQAIDRHLTSMGRWVDLVVSRSPDYVANNVPGTFAGDPGEQGARTDAALVGSAELVHAALALVQIAEQRGHSLDSYAQKYGAIAKAARAAFAKRFIKADGTLTGDTQGAYALAIGLDLVPPPLFEASAKRFISVLERDGYRVKAGVLGASYLLPALTRIGRSDLAYKVLMQPGCPSWMCAVDQGATTLWENLANTNRTTALNSFAYAGVGVWLFDAVGGIALDARAPGGAHVFVRPQVGGGLTWARARYESLYGPITTSWRMQGKAFRLKVSVPPNVTATVDLPVVGATTESGRPLDRAPGLKTLQASQGNRGATLALDSGSYDLLVEQP
ncbi:MAG: family 78 glycoside hydrolase catalytic domain [Deltaproteobacteria bacterium]|nr:family 78 glycoside hydrolase catalytic domain [Deltaproteobacteria bacterium]